MKAAFLLSILVSSQAFGLPLVMIDPIPNLKAIEVIYRGSPFVPNGQIWKYTVNLILGDSSCTGVFIDRNAILTAAHCVPKTKGQIEIHRFVGSDPLLIETVEPKDYQLVSHPKYAKSKPSAKRGFDLAVLSIKPNVIAQTYEVAPMAMHHDFTAFQAGSTVYTVGAGDTGNQESDGKLYYTKGVIDGYESSNVVRIFNDIGQLCHGDSGGHSFVVSYGKSRLIGITSGVSIEDDELGCGTVMAASFLSMENSYWIGSQVLRANEHFLRLQYEPHLKKFKGFK